MFVYSIVRLMTRWSRDCLDKIHEVNLLHGRVLWRLELEVVHMNDDAFIVTCIELVAAVQIVRVGRGIIGRDDFTLRDQATRILKHAL